MKKILIILFIVLCPFVCHAFSFSDLFDKELKLTVYDFRDGTPLMVINPDDKWELGTTQGGNKIYYKDSWKDQMGNVVHWVDQDGYPFHKFKTEYEKDTLWPPTISEYTFTSKQESSRDNYYSRDSDKFRDLESRINERISDEYNGMFVETETLPPLPPPPPQECWPKIIIPSPYLDNSTTTTCSEDQDTLFKTDADMSPCSGAPEYEFMTDCFTWLFINPWDQEPTIEDFDDFPGGKKYGTEVIYKFAVPSSSEFTFQDDKYQSKILIKMDFLYRLKDSSNSGSFCRAEPSPTCLTPVFVKDETPPKEILITVPEKQTAGQPFQGKISCTVTDNNPNLEQCVDLLEVELELHPEANTFLEQELELSNYSAEGSGTGEDETSFFSTTNCSTETFPDLKPTFKGFVQVQAITSKGFGGVAEEEAPVLIQVFDYIRPTVEIILEDKMRDYSERIGPVEPGNVTDTDMITVDMPGSWVEDTRYLLTIQVKDNIEVYSDPNDPGNVQQIPDRNIHYVGYCLAGDLMPSKDSFTDITQQIIANNKADNIEVMFRFPDTYYLWIIAEDNASRIKPESFNDNVRILKIPIDVTDTRMRTEQIK